MQDTWKMEEEKEFVETCAANFSVIVGGPSKGLSVVGSGAQGHRGDEDDLGKEGFKATERSTSKGGRGGSERFRLIFKIYQFDRVDCLSLKFMRGEEFREINGSFFLNIDGCFCVID